MQQFGAHGLGWLAETSHRHFTPSMFTLRFQNVQKVCSRIDTLGVEVKFSCVPVWFLWSKRGVGAYCHLDAHVFFEMFSILYGPNTSSSLIPPSSAGNFVETVPGVVISKARVHNLDTNDT